MWTSVSPRLPAPPYCSALNQNTELATEPNCCKVDSDFLYQGRAVQVDPIKSKLKLPGTKRLKLNRDVLLSTSAIMFNLRRYIMALPRANTVPSHPILCPNVTKTLQ